MIEALFTAGAYLSGALGAIANFAAIYPVAAGTLALLLTNIVYKFLPNGGYMKDIIDVIVATIQNKKLSDEGKK